MNENKKYVILSLLIIILALAAAIPAVIPEADGGYMISTAGGDEILMHGSGIYRRDSRSYAVQAIAQDWVTIVLAVPMLAAALILRARGSYRGRLLHCGILAYFLYTYGSYAFLVSYNELFLLYVALFSLSLFGFIESFAALDAREILSRVEKRFPVKTAAVFFIIMALMLSLMWLGRIVPALIEGRPPFGLENYTTLVIQALDLGVIVPLAVISAAGLLKRSATGYALSFVISIKGLALFSAVSAMAVMMKLKGVEISPAELIIFPAATLFNIYLCIRLLCSINPASNSRRHPEHHTAAS